MYENNSEHFPHFRVFISPKGRRRRDFRKFKIYEFFLFSIGERAHHLLTLPNRNRTAIMFNGNYLLQECEHYSWPMFISFSVDRWSQRVFCHKTSRHKHVNRTLNTYTFPNDYCKRHRAIEERKAENLWIGKLWCSICWITFSLIEQAGAVRFFFFNFLRV